MVLHGLGEADAIEALRSRLAAEHGVEVGYVAGDLAARGGPEQMIAAALAGGRLDILVNNAGIQFVSPVDEFPPERCGMAIGTEWLAPGSG